MKQFYLVKQVLQWKTYSFSRWTKLFREGGASFNFQLKGSGVARGERTLPPEKGKSSGKTFLVSKI